MTRFKVLLMMVSVLWIILVSILISHAYALQVSRPLTKSRIPLRKSIHVNKQPTHFQIAASAGSNVSVVDKLEVVKNNAARVLGYVMGAGAMVIYAPILVKILRNGHADGLSLATWVFNVLGLSLAAAYPAKKGFPLSAYLELVAASVQSVAILLLIAFHKGQLLPTSVGLAFLSVAFLTFLRAPVPASALGGVQIAASLLANYANVPQILLSFRTKHSSWSGVTALMSMAGCFIRMLTTIQLTKDKLVLGGYALGFVTNSLLFAQVLLYGKK